MSQLEDVAKRARAAAAQLRSVGASRRAAGLAAMASRIRARASDILKANQEDVAEAKQAGLGDAKLDRLILDAKRIEEVAKGLEAVASQPDPVGRVADERRGPSGILCRRVRVPIGVVLMIFEARPNVTVPPATVSRYDRTPKNTMRNASTIDV